MNRQLITYKSILPVQTNPTTSPYRIAETKMLEGELIYAETGNSKEANSLISKASKVFRNLGFKLLENEAARIIKTIPSNEGV